MATCWLEEIRGASRTVWNENRAGADLEPDAPDRACERHRIGKFARQGRSPLQMPPWAARCAPTTGLRWLAALEDRGLVRRFDDARDGRRKLVVLNSRAKGLVETGLKLCDG